MGDGTQQTVQATGNGPVDATFNAIQQAGAAQGQARALPGARRDRGHRRAGRGVGAARGEAEGGRAVTARAADPDTLVASAKAYSQRAQQAVRQARPPARADGWRGPRDDFYRTRHPANALRERLRDRPRMRGPRPQLLYSLFR